VREPLVTVIMPCFNHGQYVAESIKAVLAQTFSDLELIVIDDCSADSSVQEVLELKQSDARLHLLRHGRNLGPSRSRNDGIAAARGQFLAFCDADDTWLPEKLERQVSLLQSHTDFGLTYCDASIIDQAGKKTGQKFSDLFPLPVPPSGGLFAALCAASFINTQSVLVRRRLIASSEWFDERIRCNEDWWLWLRLSRLTKFFYEPAVMANYRIHPASTSRTQPARYKRDLWRLCKRNLRAHPDMPRYLQGLMWYQMGSTLYSLGRRRTGRIFMRRGIVDFIRGGGSFARLLRMGVRYFQATLGWSIGRR